MPDFWQCPSCGAVSPMRAMTCVNNECGKRMTGARPPFYPDGRDTPRETKPGQDDGVEVLNSRDGQHQPRTAVIAGTGLADRVVLGLLERLGVHAYYRTKFDSNPKRDWDWQDTMLGPQKPDKTEQRRFLKERDSAHDVWALTMDSRYVLHSLGVMRNPYLLVAFQDHESQLLLNGWLSAKYLSREDDELAHVVDTAKGKVPTLVIDYEVAVRRPQALTAGVADFLGLKFRREAAEYLDPEALLKQFVDKPKSSGCGACGACYDCVSSGHDLR